jgi:hypothetical protein
MPARIVNLESGTQVRFQIHASPVVSGGIVDLGSAEADGSTAVSCTLVRVRARTAAINGSTAVTCTLTRTRARTAAVNGSTAVSCTLVRTRARAAVINGSTAVSAATGRTRARSATSTGSTTVTCVLTTAGVKLLTATANGSTTVTAGLEQPTEQPGGGFIFQKRPPIRKSSNVTLRPGHATVAVTAYAPHLTIIKTPGAGVVRTRPLAPMPTLTFQVSAVSPTTLGELPRSKRELIDKLVIYDTV